MFSRLSSDVVGVDGGETCVQLVTSLGLDGRAKGSRAGGTRLSSLHGAGVISASFKVLEKHVVHLWKRVRGGFCH
jgi:hypothetical protein